MRFRSKPFPLISTGPSPTPLPWHCCVAGRSLYDVENRRRNGSDDCGLRCLFDGLRHDQVGRSRSFDWSNPIAGKVGGKVGGILSHPAGPELMGADQSRVLQIGLLFPRKTCDGITDGHCHPKSPDLSNSKWIRPPRSTRDASNLWKGQIGRQSQEHASSATTPSFLDRMYGPIVHPLKQVERRLHEELQNRDDSLSLVLRHGTQLGGKRLRPAMLLLAGQATGIIDRRPLVLATVVEMVHTATLVHDDVLDDAETRRHVPTDQC